MKQKLYRLLLMASLMVSLLIISAYAAVEDSPTALEPPVISNLRLLKTESGAPYFCMELEIPETVMDLNAEKSDSGQIDIVAEGRVEEEGWGSCPGGNGKLDVFLENSVPGSSNRYYLYFEIDDKDLSEAAINVRNYTYRVRFKFVYETGGEKAPALESLWSNELSSKSEKYLGASQWARAELDKATNYGFIPDRIRGNMSGEITREEFAEIAVKLYEACTEISSETGDKKFQDTENPEILKAYNHGLVEGVGENRFAPKALITRAQMAKIIFNTLKSLVPESKMLVTGSFKFSDDGNIAQWARQCVYFCNQVSIISGFEEGSARVFRPDVNATRQTAVIVCKRAYEYFLQL